MALYLTPLTLRNDVREAMIACGGHGFVRFGPEDAPLLLTDAVSRMTAKQAEEFRRRLLSLELEPIPFSSLTGLVPSDHLLWSMGSQPVRCPIDWADETLLPILSLGHRWAEKEAFLPSRSGRRLLLNTARCCHLSPAQMLRALPALRAQGAECQRIGALSGMREAGNLLLGYCLAHKNH